jgi:hypothetical protein
MIPELGYPFVEFKCRRHVTSYLYAIDGDAKGTGLGGGEYHYD